MIRVVLPYPLRLLARVEDEVRLDVEEPVTLGRVLDCLEERHPMLCGTLRDHGTGRRRGMVRFYACRRDLSQGPFDVPLPAAVRDGREPLLVIGAIAGG